ncbi:MAG: cytochrome C [Candidatus Poribacteria bacterium]|nr:cytochrome C [Candidatus Poribacteria bacterium]
MEHFLELVTKADNVPIMAIMFLLPFFTWLAFSQARRNDRAGTPAEAAQKDKVYVWPYLCRSEFVCAIIVMLILAVWSITIDAPLEEPSNPTQTPNPSKAPWYFLALQEMLVYFDPWIAGVVLPGFIIGGLIAIPYIDINPKGKGYYTLKERPFAIGTFCFGFFVLWIVLMIVGTFLRGPGWNLFAPWVKWDPHKVVPLTNINLTYLLGIRNDQTATFVGFIFVAGYYALGPICYLWKIKTSKFLQELGLVRYIIISFLFLTMFSLPIKMALRWGANVKYVWVTPWFNI